MEQILDKYFAAFELLTPIGQSTLLVHLPELDATLNETAKSLSMQLALFKYIALLFVAYPLALILNLLPNKNLKHLFSFLGGAFMCQWVYGADWIHAFVSSAGTYVLCLVVPGKYKARVAFFWVMWYMTTAHAARMYVSYMSGIFDYTGTQMVLTMKLTSFAYNLYDGTYDHERVFKKHDDKRLDRIYSDRKRFAIEAMPNPLEFFGYVFCFTCILAGPAFEYKDYVDAMDGTAFIQRDIKENSKTKVVYPATILPGLLRLLLSIACLAGHMTLSAKFPLSKIYNVEWIASNTVIFRWGYTLLSLFAERLKYYFVWKIAEGACILGSFGFEGYDKETNEVIGWKGVENIEIFGFEFATSIQALSRSWNKRTQGWLERYTYGRTGNSLFMTYFVSALWHGLYPGYFVFFLSVPILTNCERLIKQKINPIVIPGYDGRNFDTAPKTIVTKIYWVVCWFVIFQSTHYIVQVFPLNSWERAKTALGSYYFIPYGVFFAVYVILSLVPGGEKKDEKKKKN